MLGPRVMALVNRPFMLLWQGQLVSQLGNQAFLIATALFMLEATGSATLVAAVMMASTLPVAILGPIGGTLADRHSRRAILVTTDIARAVAVGGLGLFLLWRPDVTPRHSVLIIAVAAFSGVMSAMFSPALQAAIPDLVPADRLAAANSLSQGSSQTAVLVGQALGGVLYAAWGVGPLLLFDGLSFAYAGAAAFFIPPDRRPSRPRASLRLTVWRYVLETREGVDYVWRRAGMAAVIATFAVVNFLFMPVFVLLPLYVREILGGGPEWYGFLLAGSGAGALAGSAIAVWLLGRISATATLIRLCVGGIATAMLLLAATRNAWTALGVFAAIGVQSSIITVTVVTTFQRAVAPELRGRVMALVIALSTAAVPLGMGMGGLMGDLWPESLPRVIAGCGVAMVGVAAIGIRGERFGNSPG